METLQIHANKDICESLEEYIEKSVIEAVQFISESKLESNAALILANDKGEEIKRLKTPFRLGELLDSIEKARRIGAFAKTAKIIKLKNATLDVTLGVLKRDDNYTASLTEKEVEILSLLHANKGKTVSRQDMLQKIWNYAQEVETHTLETHIYRLRQKIEKTPSQPEILITEESGYRISSEK